MLRALLVFAALASYCSAKIGCKNMKGKDVDWFAAIKLPNMDENKGFSFVYFDSTQSGWKKSPELINSTDSAIGATINQIYKSDKKRTFTVAYNDDCPGKDVDSGRGHSKGVALFDEKMGFWMLHSVPNFPPIDKYDYPESGSKYAQSFLCLSLDANFLPDIGEYMRFAQVTPFITNLPKYHEALAPVLMSVVNRKSLTRSDTIFTTIRGIQTVDGKKVKAFSKHKKSNFDLWNDFVALNLKTDMAVETWRNGAAKDVGTQCGTDRKVFDITSVTIMNLGYSSSKDHSKWGVSMKEKVPVVCIGDVNRQQSQFKRGGGTVCIEDRKLWKTFYDSIGSYTDCGGSTVQAKKIKETNN
ncbi:deoxyribonuclease II [Ancylostoma caninum]|uniref:Deoxyribonuclease II n=2 Tax=Ancylostoma caninum TaxID=29170 RepID=A0A368EW79_ANCCA|nr:deoxyribonuclease II [Ancylostoma caninum]